MFYEKTANAYVEIMMKCFFSLIVCSIISITNANSTDIQKDDSSKDTYTLTLVNTNFDDDAYQDLKVTLESPEIYLAEYERREPVLKNFKKQDGLELSFSNKKYVTIPKVGETIKIYGITVQEIQATTFYIADDTESTKHHATKFYLSGHGIFLDKLKSLKITIRTLQTADKKNANSKMFGCGLIGELSLNTDTSVTQNPLDTYNLTIHNASYDDETYGDLIESLSKSSVDTRTLKKKGGLELLFGGNKYVAIPEKGGKIKQEGITLAELLATKVCIADENMTAHHSTKYRLTNNILSFDKVKNLELRIRRQMTGKYVFCPYEKFYGWNLVAELSVIE